MSDANWPALAPNCKLMTKGKSGALYLHDATGRVLGVVHDDMTAFAAAIEMAAWDDELTAIARSCHSPEEYDRSGHRAIEFGEAQLSAWTEIWRECQKGTA